MNNFFKILIVLSFLAQIYSSVKIVNQEKFDQLLKDNNCKGIIYKDCLDFLDEISSFKKNFPFDHLQKEKIYINEAPQKHNKFKHTYTISKNGINYFLPLYILESNLSNTNKINKEHTISVGDEILVYHLFNKVFFAELLSKPIIESTAKIESIDYTGPESVENENAYNIKLTESDWNNYIKKEYLSLKNKTLDSFVDDLQKLNSEIPYVIDINPKKNKNEVILQRLRIEQQNIIDSNQELKDIYKPDRAIYLLRMKRERTTRNRWPKDMKIYVSGGNGKWGRLISDTRKAKTLEILTYWINLHQIEDVIQNQGNKKRITNSQNLWILKLFEGKGVTYEN